MQPQKPSKRSANTCGQCRARKVRCDGRRDVCSGCERLGLSCSFQRGDAEVDALHERRRTRLACEACHALKARCTGELPHCKRCRTKGVDCVYPSSKRAPARARSSLGPARSTSDQSATPTPINRPQRAPTRNSTAPSSSFDVS
jgi:hypothetical protein